MDYRNCSIEDVNNICALWNSDIASLGFYKELNPKSFIKDFVETQDFSWDYVFGAFDNGVLVGYIIGILRNSEYGVINTIVVKQSYRFFKIGEKLLDLLEKCFINKGKVGITVSQFLPYCYGWYIPRTCKHDHPCAPGVRINSDLYFFLLKHGYSTTSYSDAFHLSLKEYELSPSINAILETNKKDGLVIEFYNQDKHFGIDEFIDDIKAPDFARVILSNLALEKPYPFLVISDHGKVVGWTGALWNEDSGRGHFDGIIISEKIRGRGLGKALFATLAYESKKNGAQFMTFYTGLTNHARYIYLGAGFKIVQSFCFMKKQIK